MENEELIGRQVLRIRKFSLINKYFAMLDTDENILAKTLLYYGIRFTYISSMISDKFIYEIRFLRVPKTQIKQFFKAIENYPRIMKMHGHEDYLDFCDTFFKDLTDNNEENKEQE